MQLKKFWKEIPKVPFSALIFHIVITILWNVGMIPPPTQMVDFLQGLYSQYGFVGLIIATFFEGIAYLGLYFPGASVIALAVFFSDGQFLTLLNISIVVAITLTLASFVNYFFGKHIHFKNKNKIGGEKFSKGLLLSILHPNLLALYFFNEGLERKNFIKIFFVPILMIPYGLLFAYVLYIFSNPIKSGLDNSFFIALLIFGWIVVAFAIEHQRNLRKKLKETFR